MLAALVYTYAIGATMAYFFFGADDADSRREFALLATLTILWPIGVPLTALYFLAVMAIEPWRREVPDTRRRPFL